MSVIQRIAAAVAPKQQTTPADLERKLPALRGEVAAAERAVNHAALAIEDGLDGARKQKDTADERLRVARAKVSETEGALEAARTRQAARQAEERADAERQQREARNAAYKRLQASAKVVPVKLAEFVSAVRATFVAAEEVAFLVPEHRARIKRAFFYLPLIINWHLSRFLPDAKIVPWLDEGADWSAYLKLYGFGDEEGER